MDRIKKPAAGWHDWNMVREASGRREVKGEGRGQLKLVLELLCQGQRRWMEDETLSLSVKDSKVGSVWSHEQVTMHSEGYDEWRCKALWDPAERVAPLVGGEPGEEIWVRKMNGSFRCRRRRRAF